MSDAITVRDVAPGPGEYLCVATRAWWTGFLSAPGHRLACIFEQLLTEWVPHDPADDWLWDRRMTGERRWLVGNDDEARALGIDASPRWPTGRWQAAHGDWFGAREASWGFPTPEFLAELPTEPDALLRRLEGAGPGVRGVSKRVAALLRTGRVPAELRAALYAVLDRAPGLAVEAGRNVDGVEGIAFVVEDAGRRTELIVDPDGGAFIGERETVLDVPETGLPPGTVTSETAVRSGISHALGEMPARLSPGGA
ncbi:MAG: hypothetical protein ABS81_23570 [Pseudonocardia sp. SCN 72-86]|nr:MAG: hypothetical protein ABS81_23570 [Pseudonocardia sp. SCN 72-86]